MPIPKIQLISPSPELAPRPVSVHSYDSNNKIKSGKERDTGRHASNFYVFDGDDAGSRTFEVFRMDAGYESDGGTWLKAEGKDDSELDSEEERMIDEEHRKKFEVPRSSFTGRVIGRTSLKMDATDVKSKQDKIEEKEEKETGIGLKHASSVTENRKRLTRIPTRSPSAPTSPSRRSSTKSEKSTSSRSSSKSRTPSTPTLILNRLSEMHIIPTALYRPPVNNPHKPLPTGTQQESEPSKMTYVQRLRWEQQIAWMAKPQQVDDEEREEFQKAKEKAEEELVIKEDVWKHRLE